ncbi:MAG: amidase domain-containing protein [Candidatus Omnitrophota bacterium]
MNKFNTNLKKFINAFILGSMIFCLSLVSFASTGGDRNYGDVYRYDEDEIKNTIGLYFDLRYESQKLLEPQDFSFLVSDKPEAREWLKREQDKQEIELYVASIYRLNYLDYKYHLDYERIRIKGNRAEVTLNESHEVIFESCAPEVSKLFNLEHRLTMEKRGNSWELIRDDYDDELSPDMKNESKEEILETVRENFSTEWVQREESPVEQLSLDLALAPYSYNRNAASVYAAQYCGVGKYNPLYTLFGKDCTNFVSQAIYEGTSHTMSAANTSHYWDWWYFTGNPRTGSAPWINVDYLYSFLVNNSGQGPYGYAVTSTCSLNVGDVVQLYNSQGWFHSVIVNAVSNCSDTNKIFICGHSSNRCNYPLSNYASYKKRYIHISGYRK